MPIIRRKLKHEYQFTQIPNDWLRDPQLSLKAKGLLAQLLSHSEGWSLTIGTLAKANDCGKDSVAKGVKELESAGYLKREQGRSDVGKFSEVIWVTSEPDYPLAGFPSPDKPSPDKPAPENPPLKNTNKKNTNNKKTIEKKDIADDRWNEQFQIFWNTYPRKVGIANARKAFEKHAEKYLAEMLDGAVRMASDPNLPETTFIPHPSTWLNREGWNDEPYPDQSRKGAKMSNAQRNLLDYERAMKGVPDGEGRSPRAIGTDQPY